MEKQYLSMEALNEGKLFVGESPIHEGVTVYVKLVDGKVKYGYDRYRIGMNASTKFFTVKNFVECEKEPHLTKLGLALLMEESVLINVKTVAECEHLMTAIENSTELVWRNDSKPTEHTVVGYIQVKDEQPFSEGAVISYWSKLNEQCDKYTIVDFDHLRKVMIEEK